MRLRAPHSPFLFVLFGLVLLASCSSTEPSRDPTGELFPEVSAETLDGEAIELPADLAGAPAVLLVGYLQETQFDIDRWFLGLLQADIEAPIYEIPTLPELAPTLASRWIDDGMRSGIPEEDWGAVVTLYGDAAEPVARFTGTENGRRARVLLLDTEGRVAWFGDRGYSASQALEVARAAEELARASEAR